MAKYDSVLKIVETAHSLGELQSVLQDILEACSDEVSRLRRSGVRSQSLQFDPAVLDPAFMMRINAMLDGSILLVDRIDGECEELPVDSFHQRKVWALVKDVLLYAHAAKDAPGLLRKNLLNGNLKGVISRISYFLKNAASAREMVESFKFKGSAVSVA